MSRNIFFNQTIVQATSMNMRMNENWHNLDSSLYKKQNHEKVTTGSASSLTKANENG